ncbi:C-myc promoter-binding protein [Halotydeus destructor]|nr:C-myc promoter-binding protein [Halotydeus destructor]
MEDRRIADYFVLAGLPDHNRVSLDDAASSYGSSSPPLSPNQTVIDPITDVSVIIRSQGEVVPKGWHCIESTPLQHPADLNHGSLRSPSVYIIFRRGKDKPPLVDVGILYEGKERVMADSEVVHTTPFGRQANVNNSGSKTFLTFRRAKDNAPCSQLVVTDICVIFTNKGETPPHAFCLVHKNLNKGMVGSDVYLCYKKSMNRPPLIRYQPSILGRYPYDNYDCYALPESVPMFCMPMGATIEKWPRNCQQPRPVFSTFVLTTDSAVKLYGAAVTFYETYPEENLTEEEAFLLETKSSNLTAYSLHAVKSICILSRWSFFDTFERFLIFLYKTQSCSVNNPTTLPIERYISHFMVEVPFPTVQRPKILVQLTATSDETVLLSQPPEDMPLPLSGASFTQLLRNLGPDNCLNVLLLTLLEQKILLHSLRQDVLTGVAEALTSIIFPFHWQCPYIPLCPLNLSDVLNAPLPFIVGVDSRYFDFHEPPLDVICVDLDTNSIYLSENKRSLNVKSLPKRATRVLKNSLDELFEKLLRPSQPANGTYNAQSQVKSRILSPFSTDTIAAKKLEHQIDLEIREAFLRFMASILRNFRSYLLPITRAPTVGATDPGSLFDLAGFLRSRDKNYHRFYQLLMTTQMFTRFIEERSFVSDKDTCLAFFDQCLDKVEMVSESDAVVNMRLLDADDYLKNDRTVFIPAPEAEDERTFKYHSFGPLNEGLFHLHPDTSARKISADETGRSCSTSQLNFTVTTGSPLSRRTKQEVRVALKNARRHSEAPLTWAKCLVSYCYSLWFIHLPAYAKSTSSQSTSNNTPLKIAIEVLQRMETVNLHPMDEVCYRVLMLLCGEYGQPALAVKVLFEMKEHGVVPNAITYGYYNKAVLESKWPTGGTTATILWSRLRNVLSGVVEFKRRGRQRSSSIDSKAKSDKAEDKPTDECDAENFMTEKSKLENAGLNFGASNAFRKRAGSIIKASPSTFGVEINAKSSAGLLMTTSLDTTKRDTFNLPLKSVHSQIHGTVTSTKSMSPTVELPPMKQYSRSFSFGNDSKILNKLQEGSLKALKQEIERSHHQVVEEVAEENFLKEFDGDVPDSHNVPSNLLIELENGDSGVSVNSEQLRYNVTSTPNSKSNKESNGKPVNHEMEKSGIQVTRKYLHQKDKLGHL